jgi:hypothetical protein
VAEHFGVVVLVSASSSIYRGDQKPDEVRVTAVGE